MWLDLEWENNISYEACNEKINSTVLFLKNKEVLMLPLPFLLEMRVLSSQETDEEATFSAR